MERSEILSLKYGDLSNGGWGPRLRAAAGHTTPDDEYEFMLESLVSAETDWLDVGCGRNLLPQNENLGKILAQRAKSLTGIDPDPNVLEHPLLINRQQCMIQDYYPGRTFNLITMRMVVEHVADPASFTAALSRLISEGGRVLIYTVNKWSPASIVSKLTPMSFHHAVKQRLWQTEERDTFPVAYKMNTRGELKATFQNGNLIEEDFSYLSDTRATQHIRFLNRIEIGLWRALQSVNLIYPENCLLGLYRKHSA